MDAGVLDLAFPEVADIERLTERELRSVMIVAASEPNKKKIESYLRRLFVWAIVRKASDIHIEGRGDQSRTTVFIHVRTHAGMKKKCLV